MNLGMCVRRGLRLWSLGAGGMGWGVMLLDCGGWWQVGNGVRSWRLLGCWMG